MSGRIRIEATGDMGITSRVIYIGTDGRETDISDVVQKVEFSTDVYGPNRAIVHVVMARGEMTAELIDIIKTECGPNVTDVTVLADEYTHLSPSRAA